MSKHSFIAGWAAAVAVLLSLSLPAGAHEGHEHGAEAKPADIRLAPRFEVRGEAVEVVGVLAGKDLVVYLDGIDDNAPVEGAEIEIEGQGFKGMAAPVGGGVYQLAAAPLAQPGKHPLTLTVQAGEVMDLLSASLEVEAAPAPPAAGDGGLSSWWLAAGIPFLMMGGGWWLRRQRRQAEARN